MRPGLGLSQRALLLPRERLSRHSLGGHPLVAPVCLPVATPSATPVTTPEVVRLVVYTGGTAQLHITSISYLFFCFLRFSIVSENRALMKEAYQPWPTCWRGNTPHLSHIQMLWSTLLQLEVTCSALISCGHMTHAPSMVRLRNASTDRCIHQVFSGSAFPRPPASYILYRCTLGLPCTYGTYI